MIVFDLRCAPAGHVFEAWFGSSDDFDAQKARGLVSCPICGGANVDKAPMAPAVPAKGNRQSGAAPAEIKAMLAEIARIQKKILSKSENVGDRFPEEARAIHLGEADARAIYGRAAPGEVRSLIEEGVPVAPLPLPIPDAGEEH